MTFEPKKGVAVFFHSQSYAPFTVLCRDFALQPSAAMADALYCRLNARGRKQFKPSTRSSLLEKYPEFSGIGLPAHKAALDGNVDGLKEIFTTSRDEGVPSRDRNGATPLHLAARSNRLEAVK